MVRDTEHLGDVWLRVPDVWEVRVSGHLTVPEVEHALCKPVSRHSALVLLDVLGGDGLHDLITLST